MKIIEKLKKDKKLLFIVIGLVIATFSVPYLTIPGLILGWFYKKSKFSKKAKVITTAIVGILFALLVTGSVIAYSKDAEPHLNIAEPSLNTAVKGQKVTIRGTYEPLDRRVWINGKEITASNGNFEYSYELKEGENKIDVSAGNWKRTHVFLIVIRELTEEEKAARITPTPTPTTSPQTSTIPTITSKVSILPSSTPNIPQQSGLYIVSSVIDGDTIKVVRGSEQETLRLIGIDTPETVDPRKTVQCFGKEASAKAKSLLSGKSVRLEADPTQGERDKYQRLLRYVFLEDGTSFNKLMISEGYAHEYTYGTPYKYQSEYKQAQKEAETNKRGLWADNTCAGDLTVATITQAVQQTVINNSSTTTTITNANSTSNNSTSGNCKYSCSGPDRDCSDFATHAEAQAFFNCCGFTATYDPMKLDSIGVGNGIACED